MPALSSRRVLPYATVAKPASVHFYFRGSGVRSSNGHVDVLGFIDRRQQVWAVASSSFYLTTALVT